jgi:hypothetical protein
MLINYIISSSSGVCASGRHNYRTRKKIRRFQKEMLLESAVYVFWLEMSLYGGLLNQTLRIKRPPHALRTDHL